MFNVTSTWTLLITNNYGKYQQLKCINSNYELKIKYEHQNSRKNAHFFMNDSLVEAVVVSRSCSWVVRSLYDYDVDV